MRAVLAADSIRGSGSSQGLLWHRDPGTPRDGLLQNVSSFFLININDSVSLSD